MLGGAAMLGGCRLWPEPPTSGARAHSVLDGPPGSSGIDTIVVCMMENRSFDSYLGWLARDQRYLDRGRSLYGGTFFVNGKSFQQFHAPDGTMVPTNRRVLYPDADPWRACGHPDPGHGWNSGARGARRWLPRARQQQRRVRARLLRRRGPARLRPARASIRRLRRLARVDPRPDLPEPLVPALGSVGRQQVERLPAGRERMAVGEHPRAAGAIRRHRGRVLRRPPDGRALGSAHASVPANDDALPRGRGRRDAAERQLRHARVHRRRRAHRRPPARRPARRATVRARRLRRVRAVAAVAEGSVRPHLRRVGWVLRPRRSSGPSRRPRQHER